MSFRSLISQNLKTLAQQEAYKLDRWFRRKYNLSPHDPRYLETEFWEMELDYEIDSVLDEDVKLTNFCPVCQNVIIGNYCTTCKKTVPTEKYYDPSFDEYFEELEAEGKGLKTDVSSLGPWEEVK